MVRSVAECLFLFDEAGKGCDEADASLIGLRCITNACAVILRRSVHSNSTDRLIMDNRTYLILLPHSCEF